MHYITIDVATDQYHTGRGDKPLTLELSAAARHNTLRAAADTAIRRPGYTRIIGIDGGRMVAEWMCDVSGATFQLDNAAMRNLRLAFANIDAARVHLRDKHGDRAAAAVKNAQRYINAALTADGIVPNAAVTELRHAAREIISTLTTNPTTPTITII